MFDLPAIRAQFPALGRVIRGKLPTFLDGPGGTQVPRGVIEAISDYLSRCNANHGGLFTTSRESDAILDKAHEAVADLLNAPSPHEVIFGLNMTTLTFHLSRSLARTWKPGDVVVVTRLDHDANVRPWVLAARDAGAEVRFVEVRREDGTLDEADFSRKLQGKVRIVALTCASNALGTMPPVAKLIAEAHQAGALIYLDAVHFAPHRSIDVAAWDCDFLACSAYKFFGPHVGILWGKGQLLEELEAYKVRPAPDTLPGKWMTGTANHEGIAGVLAAVEYLENLGTGETRRLRLEQAMASIVEHETDLCRRLIQGIQALPGFRIWGLTGEDDLDRRTPTLAVTHRFKTAPELAEILAREEIFSWAGHFYAVEVAETMGVMPRGGFLRLGLVHYNSMDEVERTLRVLSWT